MRLGIARLGVERRAWKRPTTRGGCWKARKCLSCHTLAHVGTRCRSSHTSGCGHSPTQAPLSGNLPTPLKRWGSVLRNFRCKGASAQRSSRKERSRLNVLHRSSLRPRGIGKCKTRLGEKSRSFDGQKRAQSALSLPPSISLALAISRAPRTGRCRAGSPARSPQRPRFPGLVRAGPPAEATFSNCTLQ